ncbi:MAG: uridine phosphorylase [Paracoccaceae bacterium]
MNSADEDLPLILAHKYYGAPSAFTPESLLREARRQKGAATVSVPKVCLLDPDADIVRQLKADGRAHLHEGWVCYHTDLFVFENGGLTMGVVGCAVGASFAALFHADRSALRDEGTSYHYLPPSDWSDAPEALLDRLTDAFTDLGAPVLRGATWTTDAPFRETEQAIMAMKARNILAVEMEAAGLYAFAAARGRRVVCFAHVTNQMGQIEGDFEKGDKNGTAEALELVRLTAERLCALRDCAG